MMRNEEEAGRAVALYADMVRRICFIHLKKYEDVEDAFQEIFLKYVLHKKIFESPAHEKAWLIRVAINVCKDMLRSPFRKRVCSIEDIGYEPFYTQDGGNESELLDCILSMPPNYRNVIYLFYYEGYSAVEIAKIMNKKENTIYTWLGRARKELKGQLEQAGGGFVG